MERSRFYKCPKCGQISHESVCVRERKHKRYKVRFKSIKERKRRSDKIRIIVTFVPSTMKRIIKI